MGDLDKAVIFYGGPSAKQEKIRNFLTRYADKVAIEWTSDVSKLHLLKATSAGVSVRALLRQAGIETRQEEETRTRLQANLARAKVSQHTDTVGERKWIGEQASSQRMSTYA